MCLPQERGNNMSYIKERDKKYIQNYCKVQIKNDDLIRVKSLVCLLDNKYALYEIIQYIRDILKIDNKYIWRGNLLNYIVKLPRGHIQLVNDLYFNNCYLHQYIVLKELNLDIKQVQQYIIHHINQDKANNDINNLWIFYDRAVHLAYHQAIKRDPNIDIKQFTKDYIESIITDKNTLQIKQYLKILDKLESAKNKKCLSTPIDKH